MKNSSITIIACLFSIAAFAQAPAEGPGTQPQSQQQPPPQQYQQQYNNPPPQQDMHGQRNESGRDKIAYIDNHGQQATTTAIPYAGTCDPQWTAQWRKEMADGHLEHDGKLYQSFSYQGANGAAYQTRIVATATNDPMNRFTVRFQSKQADERGENGNDGRYHEDDGYHDGRVIILDWDHNPWQVDVYYSNEKGIYFMFSPFQR